MSDEGKAWSEYLLSCTKAKQDPAPLIVLIKGKVVAVTTKQAKE